MTDLALLDAVRRHKALETRYAEAERERTVRPLDPAATRLVEDFQPLALKHLGGLPRLPVVWFPVGSSTRGWFRHDGLESEVIGLRADLAGEEAIWVLGHELGHAYCWHNGITQSEFLADAIAAALLALHRRQQKEE